MTDENITPEGMVTDHEALANAVADALASTGIVRDNLPRPMLISACMVVLQAYTSEYMRQVEAFKRGLAGETEDTLLDKMRRWLDGVPEADNPGGAS